MHARAASQRVVTLHHNGALDIQHPRHACCRTSSPTAQEPFKQCKHKSYGISSYGGGAHLASVTFGLWGLLGHQESALLAHKERHGTERSP